MRIMAEDVIQKSFVTSRYGLAPCHNGTDPTLNINITGKRLDIFLIICSPKPITKCKQGRPLGPGAVIECVCALGSAGM